MIHTLENQRWKQASGDLLGVFALLLFVFVGFFIAYMVYEALGMEAFFITIVVLSISLAIIIFAITR